jgi:hypothetical protein
LEKIKANAQWSEGGNYNPAWIFHVGWHNLA